jgi:hypothetical protein
MAHAVGAAHRGEVARAGEMRSGGYLSVDWLQRGSVHAHQRLAVAGGRLGKLLATGRFAERAEYGGIH